ncbi:aldose 1-epimerase family protein [Lichenihabitans sp. Uapishka_5]|uniref:aldose 1-epimerase family protein n=1 Tax=Lichenihabitans sp. Uapishka_5 TaxID=3037302 RepID=UPI0029E8257B|nr:aldose 1-epimerase family protein [Lichenihabitans sp. Uapishka_5]MDX7951091.1 aldose 1-epimerase family protein [Lichenihabitans sp. Uapishka_5]
MTTLYGRPIVRRDLAARSGALAAFGGVRLLELCDGVERGNRMLEFRTGSGLRFTVLLDRGMDLAECEHNGRAIGWHSPAGFRNPALHEPEGEGGLGFLRSFSGLLATCGLDHVGFMAEEPADHYNYGPRHTVRHAIHGRVSMVPARLTGYGERWEGDRCILWAEGVVRQAALFGENLVLVRRIEADLGGDAIRLSDRVVNEGFYPTPHMVCYHFNIGYPVLSQGSRYLAPIADVVWASHAGDGYRRSGVGYRTMPEPQPRFHEQVWQHEMAAAPDGVVPVALVNDALGLGLMVDSRKDQLPCFYQWQNFQAGAYALGIEPATNHILGHAYARQQGELAMLDHGEERRYDLTLHVLPGAEAIAAAEARIRAIAGQPDTEFPAPSGRHLPLAAAPQGTIRP